jgi:cobalamin biosynthesis protein CobD/CbiB
MQTAKAEALVRGFLRDGSALSQGEIYIAKPEAKAEALVRGFLRDGSALSQGEIYIAKPEAKAEALVRGIGSELCFGSRRNL